MPSAQLKLEQRQGLARFDSLRGQLLEKSCSYGWCWKNAERGDC